MIGLNQAMLFGNDLRFVHVGRILNKPDVPNSYLVTNCTIVRPRQAQGNPDSYREQRIGSMLNRTLNGASQQRLNSSNVVYNLIIYFIEEIASTY